jgi:Ni,Fe-hydrogenase I large subunit
VNSEGRLDIVLPSRAGDPVHIASKRPVHASRLLQNKTVAEARRTIPRLFSICGQAQAVAFARAAESASNNPAEPAAEHHRDGLVALETLREHLWRVLLDWPRLIGESQRPERLAELNRALQGLIGNLNQAADLGSGHGAAQSPAEAAANTWPTLTATVEQAVLGCPAKSWRQIQDPDRLKAWAQTGNTVAARLVALVLDHDWQALGRCPVTPLPALPAADLIARLTGSAARSFIERPTWNGACHETGALARQADHPLVRDLAHDCGNGLLTRLAARLIEICELLDTVPARLRESPRPLPISSEQGLAQVEAARGRLVHRLQLDGDRITQYAILAPTEWNFHPRGVAAQALTVADSPNPRTREQQARLLVNAIDPCVAFDLRTGTDA